MMRRRPSHLIVHDEVMPLYPHLANRLANAVPGLCLVVFAASQLPNAEVSWFLFIIVIAGTLLMIRGYRMGARCNESAVIVYGLLYTRTIAKSAITSARTPMWMLSPLSVGEPRVTDGGGPQLLPSGESAGSSNPSA